MAETNGTTKEAATAATKKRKYEVVAQIKIAASDIRTAGQTITEGEISPADLQKFIDLGFLRDGDAPIPPSKAEGALAKDRLLSIAKRLGVVTQDGGDYSLGEKTAKGLTAFRDLVTLDELEEAIVRATTNR